MKIISNNAIPKEALANLRKVGDVLSIETEGITYSAISGHPDVFFCVVDNILITAPNIPNGVIQQLAKLNIDFIYGDSQLGGKYPDSAKYNVVVTDSFLIHNLNVTDDKIKNMCLGRTAIHVNQAYTRCNLLPLANNKFITSDMGIYDTLQRCGIDVLYVDPKQISLPGFNNGFFGGACGVYQNNIYVIGSLSEFGPGREVSEFLKKNKYNIVELYNGPVYDGGSLLFIED